MDILDSLFHDLRTINSYIQAQDVQLAQALKGVSKGQFKSKSNLTKSRGALPSLPQQRLMSKSKLISKPSLKKIGGTKSKGLIGAKSSKVLAKKKPKTQQTTAKLLSQKPQAYKLQKKHPIPSAAVRPAPKRLLVPSTKNLQSTSLTPAPPETKKPPTLTDGNLPVYKFRAEFRRHMQEIEKMKDLLADSPEETEVLKEMNGVVSVLLKKSQSYLSKADNSLRNANAEAPNHYKDILRKLLDNQSKTTIVISPKPASSKVPIFKKMQIEYSDRTQKDLNNLLKKHPQVVGSAEPTSTNQESPRSEFNFPDIFDRVYAKPQKLKTLEKEFDLSSFSSAKLIERAQHSLSSTISSESINNYKRETSDNFSPVEYIAQSSPRAPLRAEEELDAVVKNVIQNASRHNNTRKLPEILEPVNGQAASNSIVSPLMISTSNFTEPTHAAAIMDPEVDFTLINTTFAPTPTKFPSSFPIIDEDLAMLTPSLFTRKPPANQDNEDEREDKQTAFEMDLIRCNNQNERERIHGQMNQMRSRMDSLLGMSPSSAAQYSSDVNIEELLPRLAQYNIQMRDDDKKLGEHEDLLHKVFKALVKKANQDDKGVSSEGKDISERKVSREASKPPSASTGESNKKAESASKQIGDDLSGNKSKMTPAPPALHSALSNQTPRTRKLAKAISLSTMHEVEGENDDDSAQTGNSKREKYGKRVYGSSRPTEKSLAAIEATKERTRHYDSTRPTEVDMKF